MKLMRTGSRTLAYVDDQNRRWTVDREGRVRLRGTFVLITDVPCLVRWALDALRRKEGWLCGN